MESDGSLRTATDERWQSCSLGGRTFSERWSPLVTLRSISGTHINAPGRKASRRTGVISASWNDRTEYFWQVIDETNDEALDASDIYFLDCAYKSDFIYILIEDECERLQIDNTQGIQQFTHPLRPSAHLNIRTIRLSFRWS